MSDSPTGYNPFKMKAGKASGHDNSPMKKNFGQFGVGTSEMPEKPTPNKFFGNMMGGMGMGMGGSVRKMMEKFKAKKAAKAEEMQGTSEAPDATETMMDAQPAAQDAEAGGAMEAEGAEGGGDVPVHGVEAHKKGAGGKGGMFGKIKGMLGKGGSNSGAFSGMFSDVRLKEKIEKTGISPSGIPIYEFNYIGSNNRYSGAMAQDLLEINPGSVMMDSSGYYKVNYNNIDVDMHQIN